MVGRKAVRRGIPPPLGPALSHYMEEPTCPECSVASPMMCAHVCMSAWLLPRPRDEWMAMAKSPDFLWNPHTSHPGPSRLLLAELGSLNPGPLVLRELMRRIGIRSRRVSLSRDQVAVSRAARAGPTAHPWPASSTSCACRSLDPKALGSFPLVTTLWSTEARPRQASQVNTTGACIRKPPSPDTPARNRMRLLPVPTFCRQLMLCSPSLKTC